ncbi:methyltransferase domain-containing protein [Streptomyces sp. 3MP-14]|uniref:Methyltransferase domain-containing protein n=1 Tax=Streptomyces mimosae TaxID=2586635 RepID=A0A5N6APA0_9ACTN|nr:MULTISPECIES: methyltransferase [Streptomyces]KAB8169906.1 methyltransferase domain-containing protein [Streptomyces mimosae]KAB8178654.1 methyltransferase domain-containing protein [Streptomyces sp. 3MP-14]
MASGSITISEADYVRILVHGTTAFELLRTALEFELFEKLDAADGMTVDEVAEAIGVERQPARVLLLGLASLRLLEKPDPDSGLEGTYVNSAVVKRKLLRSSPRYLGPLVDIQADVINASLVDFAESMRQNTNVGLRHIEGPGTTLYERLTAHPKLQEVFYANMGDASKKAFSQVLDNYDFSGLKHVIDIGGGDGTNSIELARRYPNLEVTVFDQESVTRIAARRGEDAELSKRLHFHPGDLFRDPLPEGADGILFFHIFEIWSLERNTELLRKCYDALPAGGTCLVYNFVSNDAGTGSMSAGLVSPYFLTLASGEGMTYSPSDMETAVRDAGFARVERYDDLGFSHSLVVGHK